MSMAMAGIHFGNTNSVISIYKDGNVNTVSNETGDRLTSTVVAYTGNEKVVGQPAKQYMVRNPCSCITNIKLLVGHSFSEELCSSINKCRNCEVLNDNGSFSYKVKVGEGFVNVSPVEAASYVFTKLLEIGELVGGDDLEDVVLTVPHNFSDEQRIALCEAAENIGCNVLRVISEPVAALLAYGLGQTNPSEQYNVLVYRLGGTSVDACVINVNSGMYRTLQHKSNNTFGANEFDATLVQHLANEFKRKYKEDISTNERALGKLRTAVEDCKHGLSTLQTTSCAVDSLYEGNDFHYKIARAKFESLCGNLFLKCLNIITDVLSSAGLDETHIDKVILVGGGARMPRLVHLIKSRFPTSDVLNHLQTDEVLAQGAALQASLLHGHEDTINTDVMHFDCLSKNIGLRVLDENGERFEILLQKNTPVPVKRTKTFHVEDTQTSVCVCLYELDDVNLKSAELLAKIVMKDLPANSSKQIVLDLEFNRNSCLKAILTENTANRKECVQVATNHLT